MKDEYKIQQRLFIGNLIKELRISAHKNLKELSDEICVKESTLKRIEDGKFSFDADILFLIFHKLQVKLEINGKPINLQAEF